MKTATSKDDLKILVLGTSRGGTTLISSALGAHPDIAMLDENLDGALLDITGGKIPANKLCIPNQIDWQKKWSKFFTIGTKAGFFRKSLFMNKIPKGRFNLQDYDTFGGMKYVCILRHPAGVIASIQKRENKKLSVALYRWQQCLKAFETLQHEYKGRVAILSFEALVAAPEGKLKSLCDFLGVDFDQTMLDGPAKNERYKTDKGFQSSKASYDDAESIWAQYPKEIREKYDAILKTCL